MNKNWVAVSKNPFLRWFWAHGGEEIIDPQGPLAVEEPEATSHWKTAVGQLVNVAQAKELAGKLPPAQRKSALTSATAAMETILDDYCGTPPRRHPWPWPGPPPWVWQIASELSLIANSLQPGTLRDEILDVAGKVVAKASSRTVEAER